MEYDLFGNKVEKKGSLKEQFILPPFSILDTQSGDWQNRKNRWMNLGIKSEIGRDAECNPTFGGELNEKGLNKYGRKPMTGISIFDPVLCELMYSWFVPENGTILDPFAGGSVRGVVANYLDYKYMGIELRSEQVKANMTQGDKIFESENKPMWICGDSNKVLKSWLTAENTKIFDFIFSCPPYYDLEVYCDDPNDLSNMRQESFNETYQQIISKSCKMLKEDSFACFVVGNCRNKDGFMMDLVGETVKAFEKAGLKFYNDIVLRNMYGTAMLRASNTMKNKKVVKVHQNVLVFVKGDPKKAAK